MRLRGGCGKSMSIDYQALNERLSQLDVRISLVKYIYDVQGFDTKRLDFKQAAEQLNCTWKTIHRYCNELADIGVITFSGNCLKLSDNIIAIS